MAMEKTELADSGLTYIPDFFSEQLADKLLEVLEKKAPWKQERNFPRLTAYYADDGINYDYSGVSHPSLP